MLSPEDWTFWVVTLVAQVAAVVYANSVSASKRKAGIVAVLVGGPLWFFAARVQCAVEPPPAPLDDYCWWWALGLGVALTAGHLLLLCLPLSNAFGRVLLLAPLLYLCGVRPVNTWATYALPASLALALPTCCLPTKSKERVEAVADLLDRSLLLVSSLLLFISGVSAVTLGKGAETLAPSHATSTQLASWAVLSALAVLFFPLRVCLGVWGYHPCPASAKTAPAPRAALTGPAYRLV